MTDIDKIALELESKIFRFKIEQEFSEIVFLCIGTNKIVGDCFGPLVGSYLSDSILNKKINVFGTLKNPITYLNFNKTSDEIKRKFKNPCIISIDAALGKKENIGHVYIKFGKNEIGKAIKDPITCESSISIKGVVGENKNRIDNFNKLSSINKKDIVKLSLITSKGIIKSLYNFY